MSAGNERVPDIRTKDTHRCPQAFPTAEKYHELAKAFRNHAVGNRQVGAPCGLLSSASALAPVLQLSPRQGVDYTTPRLVGARPSTEAELASRVARSDPTKLTVAGSRRRQPAFFSARSQRPPLRPDDVVATTARHGQTDARSERAAGVHPQHPLRHNAARLPSRSSRSATARGGGATPGDRGCFGPGSGRAASRRSRDDRVEVAGIGSSYGQAHPLSDSVWMVRESWGVHSTMGTLKAGRNRSSGRPGGGDVEERNLADACVFKWCAVIDSLHGRRANDRKIEGSRDMDAVRNARAHECAIDFSNIDCFASTKGAIGSRPTHVRKIVSTSSFHSHLFRHCQPLACGGAIEHLKSNRTSLRSPAHLQVSAKSKPT